VYVFSREFARLVTSLAIFATLVISEDIGPRFPMFVACPETLDKCVAFSPATVVTLAAMPATVLMFVCSELVGFISSKADPL